MNSKSVLILVLAVGAVALGIGIFVGRSAAPPLPIQEVSKKEKVLLKQPQSVSPPEISEKEKDITGQEKDSEESSATSNFGDRLALIQLSGPKLPDRLPVIEAPLDAEKVANVPQEPMPRIPLVKAAVERTPLAMVKPIGLSGPSGMGPEEELPINVGLVAPPGPSEIPVYPEIYPSLRPVPLIGPSSDKEPASETGSLRRLKRPVRERSEQGPLADYPVAQARAIPLDEDFKILAQFSEKEWSVRRILPDRAYPVSGRRPAPESVAGVSLPSRKKSDASSNIPTVRFNVQTKPKGGTENIPVLELEVRFSAIRLPNPRPMTEFLFIKPGDNPVSLVPVPFRRIVAERYSMKVARTWQESLNSSRTLIEPVLLSASRPEPAPALNVLNDWPPLSKFETDFHQVVVEYPLPGLYSPGEFEPPDPPADRPQHPNLPLPLVKKQL